MEGKASNFLTKFPLDILCEITAYLEWKTTRRLMNEIGCRRLTQALLHGGIKEMRITRNIDFANLTQALAPLDQHLSDLTITNYSNSSSSTAFAGWMLLPWVGALPRTLKSIDFDFADCNEIWFSKLPESPASDYTFLINSNGFVPMNMAKRFPNLRKLALRPTVLGTVLSVPWSSAMSYWWLQHLPPCLKYLETNHWTRLVNCDAAYLPLPLPPSLIALHSSCESLPPLSSFHREAIEALEHLTWGAPLNTSRGWYSWNHFSTTELSDTASRLPATLKSLNLFHRSLDPSKLDWNWLRMLEVNSLRLDVLGVSGAILSTALLSSTITSLSIQNVLQDTISNPTWPPTLTDLSITISKTGGWTSALRTLSLGTLNLEHSNIISLKLMVQQFTPTALSTLPKKLQHLHLESQPLSVGEFHWIHAPSVIFSFDLPNVEALSAKNLLKKTPAALENFFRLRSGAPASSYVAPDEAHTAEEPVYTSICQLPMFQRLTSLKTRSWQPRDDDVLLLPPTLEHLEVHRIWITDTRFYDSQKPHFQVLDAAHLLKYGASVLPPKISRSQDLVLIEAAPPAIIFCFIFKAPLPLTTRVIDCHKLGVGALSRVLPTFLEHLSSTSTSALSVLRDPFLNWSHTGVLHGLEELQVSEMRADWKNRMLPDLKTLVLGSNDKNPAFAKEMPKTVTYYSTSAIITSFDDAPPNMKTVKTSSSLHYSALFALPASVTKVFGQQLIVSQAEDLLRHLPENLQAFDANSFKSLPRLLLRPNLDFDCTSVIFPIIGTDWKLLPATLTSLDVSTLDAIEFPARAKFWPELPCLLRLDLGHKTSPPHWLPARLSASLTTLSCSGAYFTEESFHALPRSLKTLSLFSVKRFNIKRAQALPPSLTSLLLVILQYTQEGALGMLPKSLLELDLPSSVLRAELSTLPPKLQSIKSFHFLWDPIQLKRVDAFHENIHRLAPSLRHTPVTWDLNNLPDSFAPHLRNIE